MPDGIIRLDEGWHLDAGLHLDQPPNLPPGVPLPVLPKPQPGTKHMDFMPNKRSDKYLWWKNIHDTIEAQGPLFGLSVTEIANIKALAAAVIANMDATDDAKSALGGARAAETTTLGTNEAAIRMKIRNWKSTPGFTGSSSEGVLRVVGPVSSFDPLTFKPELKLSIVGGHIRVDFIKDECDSLAVYCRLRGTSTWTKLGLDTRSPYFDTNPLANPNVPEVREYMAMGVIDDIEIGLPSDIVSIVFGG